MENQERKDDCKTDGKKCGCCFGKVVIIILVFLVGGIIGYLKGQRCHYMGFGMHMPPPMEAGAMPPVPPVRGR